MNTDFSVIDYLEFSKGVLDVETNAVLPPVKRHYVRQAKELLYGIDKIHFLGEHPSVYFKSVPNFQKEVLDELTKVQRSIWNQGKVPFLYVESPTEIRVYNGFDKPINPRDNSQTLSNLQIFRTSKADTKALTELKNVFGAVSIESGDFWKKAEYANKIKFKTRVEQALIENLKATRNKLESIGLAKSIVHDILLRTLFLLYLEDRKATDAPFYQQYQTNSNSLFDILKDKAATYAIFEKLEVAFNGNLCPVSEDEKNVVTVKHLDIVKECFWSRIKEDKDQLSFFDWRIFDFSIIPIELISGIYEDFLSNEGGEENQSKTGAFYTPRPLAEFILNKVLPYPSIGDTKYDIKILDPTCGSGIFLVESLNRLLDRWEMSNPNTKLDFETICTIVKDNIYGVEQEPEAIKVAAFSLYLAMLNRLDPKNLWQNGQFPYLIYDPEKLGDPKQGNNLFRMSTISSGPFEQIDYDLVVGNPPFKQGSLDKDVSQYLTKQNFAQEAILAFLHKATILCPKGKIALVCGIKILFNTGKPYQRFRNFLFGKTYVEEVYNFSILRNVPNTEGGSLFGSATGPAGILFYSNTYPENPSNHLVYCAPKTVLKNRFMNGIAIDATDIKYIPREECTKEKTNIWKTAMWGTERDFSLIESFKSDESLLNVLERNNWKKNAGVGFQKSEPLLFTNYDIKKLPFIDAAKVERYFTPSDSTKQIDDIGFHREGNLLAYKKPHLLIKEGQEDRKFCSSFLDYDCSFTKTIYGIHIENGEQELKLISAFLNAQLSSYLMFLSSSSWGIERERVKPNEILSLPDLCFSLPEDKKEAIIQCIDEIIAIKKQNLPIYSIEAIEKRIDVLFYEALDLMPNDIVLIEDLINLTLDGFQNKKESRAFKPCTDEEMRTYGTFISQTINDFLKFGSQLTTWVKVFPVYPNSPLNIIALRLNNEREGGSVESTNDNIDALLKEINAYTYQQYAESIYYRKYIKYYVGDTTYIIKPNEKRFWSRSLAMNDADEIIADILSQ